MSDKPTPKHSAPSLKSAPSQKTATTKVPSTKSVSAGAASATASSKAASASATHSHTSSSAGATGKIAKVVIKNDAANGANEHHEHKSHRKLKIFGIVAGILVGILAIVYVAGAVFFGSHFAANTKIAGIDVSYKQPEEIAPQIAALYTDYNLEISGYEFEQTITGESISFEMDSSVDFLEDQNMWLWPKYFFEDTDLSSKVAVVFDGEALNSQLSESIAAHNETAKEPTDAYVGYNETTGKIEVIPETYGTVLNQDQIFAACSKSIHALQPKLELTVDCINGPSVLSTDAGLIKEAEQFQSLSDVDVKLMLGGNVAAEINQKSLLDLASIDEDHNVSIDSDKVASWASSLASSLNTLGGTRTYTRPDGKEITVEGGTYGWSIDEGSLTDTIISCINDGTTGEIDIPASGTATTFNVETGLDWGNRYIDVDLSEQHAYFYDDNGDCVWETDVITGNVNISGRETPTGVYYITRMSTNETLYTYEAGKKEPNKTVVKYWMPFINNVYALHDAWWQYYFGGTRYKDGYGSHGCVNLPSDKAAELYSLINVGDVVVVHW